MLGLKLNHVSKRGIRTEDEIYHALSSNELQSALETKAGPSVRDRQLLVRTRNFLHISLQINVSIAQNSDQDRQHFQLSPEHWLQWLDKWPCFWRTTAGHSSRPSANGPVTPTMTPFGTTASVHPHYHSYVLIICGLHNGEGHNRLSHMNRHPQIMTVNVHHGQDNQQPSH